jgi:hypothetical protein
VIINWAVNGEDVAAGGPSFTFGPIRPEDDGAQVQAVVRMPGLRVATDPVTLTAIPIGIGTVSPENGDTNIPVDLGAVTAELIDTPTLTVNPDDIQVTVNGIAVTTTNSKANGRTTLTYEPTDFLQGNADIENLPCKNPRSTPSRFLKSATSGRHISIPTGIFIPSISSSWC